MEVDWLLCAAAVRQPRPAPALFPPDPVLHGSSVVRWSVKGSSSKAEVVPSRGARRQHSGDRCPGAADEDNGRALHASPRPLHRGGSVALGPDSRLWRRCGPRRCCGRHRLGQSFDHERYWERVLRFFVHNAGLLLPHVGAIVEYLDFHKFIFRWEPPLPEKRKTVLELLDRVADWQSPRWAGCQAPELKWHNAGIGNFECQEYLGRNYGVRIWTIRELLDTNALAAEGKVMRHCVGNYGSRCSKRVSSIWSMMPQPIGPRARPHNRDRSQHPHDCAGQRKAKLAAEPGGQEDHVQMGCHEASDRGRKRLSEDSSFDHILVARCPQPDTDNTAGTNMNLQPSEITVGSPGGSPRQL